MSCPYIFKLHLKAEQCRQIQRQTYLNHRTHHIVQGQKKRPENIFPLENLLIIAPPHKFPRSYVLHIIETIFYHLQKRIVGKEHEQEEGNRHKCDDDLCPLHASAVKTSPPNIHTLHPLIPSSLLIYFYSAHFLRICPALIPALHDFIKGHVIIAGMLDNRLDFFVSAVVDI